MACTPLLLELAGTHCLIVGGGKTAVRRAQTLLEAGAVVVVVAKQLSDEFQSLEQANLTCHERAFEPADLTDKIRLAIAATDEPELNEQISQACREKGIWCNRCDEADAGDLRFPAIARSGSITLAVDTAGISAQAAREIRDTMLAQLDPDWPRLLELVAPYRQKIQSKFADARLRRHQLRQLTDDNMMRRLKDTGPEAVLATCEALLETDTNT